MLALDTLADRVRPDFPFFEQSVAGEDCVYLDSAATSLRPRAMIERVARFYGEISANVARGSYLPAELATELFEDARATVGDAGGFDPTEVVLVSGCTAAINLVAAGLALPPGAAVALSLFEHHANVLPWMDRHPIVWFDPLRRRAAGARVRRGGARARGPHPRGRGPARAALPGRPAGTRGRLRRPVGAQAVRAVRRRRPDWLERIRPPWLGGGTVEEVTLTSFRLRTGPARLEAGTPPVAEVIGFAAALDYLRSVGTGAIVEHEQRLLARMLDGLRAIRGVRIVDDEWDGPRAPLASIAVEGDLVTAGQLSRMLYDRHRICARAGHHCAHPYLTARGLPGTLRLAAAFYTAPREIDRACDAIAEILGALL